MGDAAKQGWSSAELFHRDLLLAVAAPGNAASCVAMHRGVGGGWAFLLRLRGPCPTHPPKLWQLSWVPGRKKKSRPKIVPKERRLPHEGEAFAETAAALGVTPACHCLQSFSLQASPHVSMLVLLSAVMRPADLLPARFPGSW